jgi:hypothetical protein
MSWLLQFFRQPGDEPLIIEEVDPLFARLPRFSRSPAQPADPLAAALVRFSYSNPITGAEFWFSFHSLDGDDDSAQDEGEDLHSDSGTEDRYQATGLELHLPGTDARPSAPELAQEAIPIVQEVCQSLRLWVFDAQSELEQPYRADADRLIASYVGYHQEVGETLEHVRQRTRRFVAIGCVFLAAAGVLLLLLALGVGHSS